MQLTSFAANCQPHWPPPERVLPQAATLENRADFPEDCTPAAGGAVVPGNRTTAPEGTSRAGLPRPDHPPRGACCPSAAASTCAAPSAAALPASGRAVSAGAAWGEPAAVGTCPSAVVPVPLREVLCGRGPPSPAAASAAAAPAALPAGAEVGGLVSCAASSPAGGAARWCHWVCSVTVVQEVQLSRQLLWQPLLGGLAAHRRCSCGRLLAAQQLPSAFNVCRRCAWLAGEVPGWQWRVHSCCG